MHASGAGPVVAARRNAAIARGGFYLRCALSLFVVAFGAKNARPLLSPLARGPHAAEDAAKAISGFLNASTWKQCAQKNNGRARTPPGTSSESSEGRHTGHLVSRQAAACSAAGVYRTPLLAAVPMQPLGALSLLPSATRSHVSLSRLKLPHLHGSGSLNLPCAPRSSNCTIYVRRLS